MHAHTHTHRHACTNVRVRRWVICIFALPGMILAFLPAILVNYCAGIQKKKNAQLPHKIDANDVVASFRVIYAVQIFPIILALYAAGTWYGAWVWQQRSSAVSDNPFLKEVLWIIPVACALVVPIVVRVEPCYMGRIHTIMSLPQNKTPALDEGR
eukprot:FR742833.1.p1 GENE.FR742833.1~~FR742833.1.p1  ORF type:complete len:155 (+),score=1.56 FR742833.1:419-883(+)